MNNPNHYQDIVCDTCKACLQDLISLFHQQGITELEVTQKACEAKETDRCYCTIWDEYSSNNVEAIVEKVYIKGNHLAVNYVTDSTEYYGDMDDIKSTDILSIYECCYNMLIR